MRKVMISGGTRSLNAALVKTFFETQEGISLTIFIYIYSNN